VSHVQPLDTPDPADVKVGVGPVPLRARLLAIACLVVVPVGLLSVLWGFVRGMPDLLLAVVVLALAAVCVWLALGRRRVARLGFLAMALALLAVAGWAMYDSGRQLLWIVVGALLLLAGGAAGRTALLAAPRPERHHLHRPMTRPQKPVLFVNPRSGDGTAGRVGLVEAARARGIEVHELQKGDDLTAMARAAADAGADCLGAAGGDGTQAQVAEVAIERQLHFVCIPAGTRNHFALDLGLDRNDPLGSLSAFGDAYTKRIDVGEANGSLFLNNVSIGAYGEVVADEQYREHKIGTALAKLPSLIGPDAEPLDLRFTDGAGEAHESALVLHVSNNAYELTPRPGFGSRPSLSDGKLGIVAVVQSSGLPGPVRVLRWEAPTFTVESGSEVPAGLDGEARSFDPPVEFRIRPSVLTVRIPLDAVGVSPSALRPRLSKTTLDRMVAVAGGNPPPA
jgi:diacylglycerol kinase family enzyme